MVRYGLFWLVTFASWSEVWEVVQAGAWGEERYLGSEGCLGRRAADLGACGLSARQRGRGIARGQMG